MTQPPFSLNETQRRLVLEAIQEVCTYRGWKLLAAHVRTYHIHTVVVAGGIDPDKVMNDFKAYSSRKLNRAGFDSNERKRWTRHGSTRYIWTEEHLRAVIRYVVDKQGTPMAVYEAPSEPRP